MSGTDLTTTHPFAQVFHLNVTEFTKQSVEITKVLLHHLESIATDSIADHEFQSKLRL